MSPWHHGNIVETTESYPWNAVIINAYRVYVIRRMWVGGVNLVSVQLKGNKTTDFLLRATKPTDLRMFRARRGINRFDEGRVG